MNKTTLNPSYENTNNNSIFNTSRLNNQPQASLSQFPPSQNSIYFNNQQQQSQQQVQSQQVQPREAINTIYKEISAFKKKRTIQDEFITDQQKIQQQQKELISLKNNGAGIAANMKSKITPGKINQSKIKQKRLSQNREDESNNPGVQQFNNSSYERQMLQQKYHTTFNGSISNQKVSFQNTRQQSPSSKIKVVATIKGNQLSPLERGKKFQVFSKKSESIPVQQQDSQQQNQEKDSLMSPQNINNGNIFINKEDFKSIAENQELQSRMIQQNHNQTLGDHISFPRIKRQSQHTDQQSDVYSLSQPFMEENLQSKQGEFIKNRTLDSYVEESNFPTPDLVQLNQMSLNESELYKVQNTQHSKQQSQQFLIDNLSDLTAGQNTTKANKNAQNLPFQTFQNNLRSQTQGGVESGLAFIQNPNSTSIINTITSKHSPTKNPHDRIKSEMSKIKVQSYPENQYKASKFDSGIKKSEENEEEDDEDEEEELQMKQKQQQQQQAKNGQNKAMRIQDQADSKLSHTKQNFLKASEVKIDLLNHNTTQSSIWGNQKNKSQPNSNQESAQRSRDQQQQPYFNHVKQKISNLTVNNSLHSSLDRSNQQIQQSEDEVMEKIYDAILQRHDLLGNKKGLPYRKFKHHTLKELNYDDNPNGELSAVRQLQLNQDENSLQKQQKYLKYVQSKLNQSIDSYPKSLEKKFNKQTHNQRHLQIVGNNFDQSFFFENIKNHFDYNRLDDALKFKSIKKDQVLLQNNQQLQRINKSLDDPEEYQSQFETQTFQISKNQSPSVKYDDGQSQNMSIIIGGMQLSEAKNLNKSDMRDQVTHVRMKSQSFGLSKQDFYTLRRTIYKSNDRSVPTSNRVKLSQIQIMLPIHNKDQTIYSVEQLNSESIKDQRKIYPLISLKHRQQRFAPNSYRAHSQVDQTSSLLQPLNTLNTDLPMSNYPQSTLQELQSSQNNSQTISLHENQPNSQIQSQQLQQQKNHKQLENLTYEDYIKKQSEGFSPNHKNQFRSLINGKKKQDNSQAQRDQANKKKMQQLQFEKIEEMKFMNELKFLAAKMAEL